MGSKIGFICSCGGSPLFSALSILFKLDLISKNNIILCTDRPCQALYKANELKIQCRCIEEPNNELFSKAAYNYLKECSCVLLLFSRIVSHYFWGNIKTYNIHPSLLPSFPGLHSVKCAYESDVKFFGASLHRVHKIIDAGPLIAQVASPTIDNSDISIWNKISFFQKTLLVLFFLSHLIKFDTNVCSSTTQYDIVSFKNFTFMINPSLNHPLLINEFLKMLTEDIGY